MTAGQVVIGFAIVAIAVTAVFLITADVWRPYLSRGLGMAQATPDPTEADRSQWPTDEYAKVQTRAEEFDAQPTLREESIPFLPGAPVPPPVRVHSQCLDAWADGKRPCGRCERILGVRA